MQASFEWIKALLPDPRVTAAALEKRFNQCGIEVSGSIRTQDVLEDVVVGEVMACEPHPESDKLSLTKVFDGSEEHPVVCGAPNVEAGQKVPFARIGTRLPNGMLIEERSIRGVVSRGMLCAADELGLALASDGILVLKPRTKAGRPVTEVLGIRDVVFELDLTPNRPDLLSHLGLAREVAALFELEPPKSKPKVKEAGARASDAVGVALEAPDLCPFYAGRVIRGVKVGPSPLEVQQRLLSLGQRPVSNVVDATNLVLLEMGQPLHAFDLHRLVERRIVVRRARPEEPIELLDGSKKILDGEELVIADAERPVALAGVMGGANSEVSDDTVDLVLESAYFEPGSVRRTARKHGLHTEASHRFERGVDPTRVEAALDACAALILELAGGVAGKGIVSAGQLPPERPLVPIRPDRAAMLLGHPVQRTQIRQALRRLGLASVPATKVPPSLQIQSPNALWFRPPPWRVDLNLEVDLIEEVSRLDGYQKVPVTMPPARTSVLRGKHDTRLDRAVREACVGIGFQEAVSLGFCSDRDFDAFGASKVDRVELANPLGEETAFLRFSLLPSLVAAAQRNQDQLPSRTDLRLFEAGRTFAWREPNRPTPMEDRRFGLLMRGRRTPASWSTGPELLDAYDLKGVLEAVFGRIGFAFPEVHVADVPWLHPRSGSALTIGGKELGFMGELHPDVAERYGLEGPPAFVAELSFDVLEGLRPPPAALRASSPHPPAQRDLSFFVAREHSAADILETVRRAVPESSAGPTPLESVDIFDVYEGEHAPEGTRSLAVALVFRAPDRTLRDDEVEAHQGAIVEALRKAHGIQLRSGG